MRKAFTLIEMLVVISLIGVLAAIALISFGSVQKSARDTTRKSDLKQYQTALEMYGNLTSGLFPSRTAVQSAYSILCGDLNIRLEPDITCSQDPKTLTDATYYDYKYITDGTNGTASATKYVLWGKLENKVNTYWVVCSNGKNGEYVNASAPSTNVCPI
jgi:prepilin-type N-terminal cleavage/methylation domain-containing protein